MATNNWTGGASAVAEVDSALFANTWASADTITSTMTAEDGSTTQTVQSTATSSTIETGVRDVHLTDLQNSSNSMFVKVTFAASGSDTITGTAKTAGIPFYWTESVTTAGDGTLVITQDGSGASTLSEGPNDWNVDSSVAEKPKPENVNRAKAIAALEKAGDAGLRHGQWMEKSVLSRSNFRNALKGLLKDKLVHKETVYEGEQQWEVYKLGPPPEPTS